MHVIIADVLIRDETGNGSRVTLKGAHAQLYSWLKDLRFHQTMFVYDDLDQRRCMCFLDCYWRNHWMALAAEYVSP